MLHLQRSQEGETRNNDLICLQWPSPPRNILLTKKNNTPKITESLVEYAQHIRSSYPGVHLLFERHAAEEVHERLTCPVYTIPAGVSAAALQHKTDLVCTLGGDGTILHASSLFANTQRFKEYKRAFREVYMSGASAGYGSNLFTKPEGQKQQEDSHSPIPSSDNDAHASTVQPTGWSSIRGKSMGSNRGARVLLRNRLRVGVFDADGNRIGGNSQNPPGSESDVYAMNEVIVHRGGDPHLAIVEVFVGGRFLTEAVADGMIISTPTGSTAYSLSSGGSIVHPLVKSLLLTPVCPRSLSFRPLVLPANTPITLRLSEKNRGREVEVSIDGVRRSKGVGVGMEVRVFGERLKDKHGNWCGGVPSVVRGACGAEAIGEDHWVGGLNGLLKFNYPFGEEVP
ncbi:NADH kinase pos5 [Coniosporium tulheliwenetii]|uniref:NADH kinase pos5 n=1 Tax=Coniosporium tulheliwenetii TaxID=3383036 RepID=A0ACC2Z5H8_9PEZI|nr:NADH kinase pos5 [Cladosporium sp. JES 115]